RHRALIPAIRLLCGILKRVVVGSAYVLAVGTVINYAIIFASSLRAATVFPPLHYLAEDDPPLIEASTGAVRTSYRIRVGRGKASPEVSEARRHFWHSGGTDVVLSEFHAAVETRGWPAQSARATVYYCDRDRESDSFST